MGVARASLDELLVDVEDHLRQHHLPIWPKDDWRCLWIRRRFRDQAPAFRLVAPLLEERPAEVAAHTLLCLLHQTIDPLDRLLLRPEDDFKREGGLTKRLHRVGRELRDGAR